MPVDVDVGPPGGHGLPVDVGGPGRSAVRSRGRSCTPPGGLPAAPCDSGSGSDPGVSLRESPHRSRRAQGGSRVDYQHALSETLALLRRPSPPTTGPPCWPTRSAPRAMVMTDLIAKHDLDIEIFSIDTGRLPEETHALAHSVHRATARHQDGQPRRRRGRGLDRGARPERLLRRRRATPRLLRRPQGGSRCGAPSTGNRAWLTGLRRRAVGDPARPRGDGVGRRLRPPEVQPDAGLDRPSRSGPTSTTTRCPTTSSTTAATPASAAHPAPARSAPGEDPRAGRWWWEMDAVKECGIHLDPATGRLRTGQH